MTIKIKQRTRKMTAENEKRLLCQRLTELKKEIDSILDDEPADYDYDEEGNPATDYEKEAAVWEALNNLSASLDELLANEPTKDRKFAVGEYYRDKLYGNLRKCTARNGRSVWFDGARLNMKTDLNNNEYTYGTYTIKA